MSEFLHKTSRALHNLAFGVSALTRALSWPHFHKPHFYKPHFYRPYLDRRIGLRNWFYAQRRLPHLPRPLPLPYRTLNDRMVDHIMARENDRRFNKERDFYTATPSYRHAGRA